ncbi:hypothetical protein J008_05205 [Cryptococcus neoformans]|nr:hypothetical protein J008_05205 [Cryptococcus neoformans var. grubii]
MAREVGKMERLAMENIGCGWRGVCSNDGSFSMFTLDCIRLDCIPRRMPHSNSLSSLATLHSTLGYPSMPDAFARLLLNIATPQHRYSSTSDSSHPTRSLSLGYPSTLAQLRDR